MSDSFNLATLRARYTPPNSIAERIICTLIDEVERLRNENAALTLTLRDKCLGDPNGCQCAGCLTVFRREEPTP